MHLCGIHVCIYVHMSVHVYVCVRLCTCMCVNIYICVYIYVCILVHTCTRGVSVCSKCICTRTVHSVCARVCMHVYVCARRAGPPELVLSLRTACLLSFTKRRHVNTRAAVSCPTQVYARLRGSREKFSREVKERQDYVAMCKYTYMCVLVVFVCVYECVNTCETTHKQRCSHTRVTAGTRAITCAKTWVSKPRANMAHADTIPVHMYTHTCRGQVLSMCCASPHRLIMAGLGEQRAH